MTAGNDLPLPVAQLYQVTFAASSVWVMMLTKPESFEKYR